jgi:hypothetical protein
MLLDDVTLTLSMFINGSATAEQRLLLGVKKIDHKLWAQTVAVDFW